MKVKCFNGNSNKILFNLEIIQKYKRIIRCLEFQLQRDQGMIITDKVKLRIFNNFKNKGLCLLQECVKLEKRLRTKDRI